MNELTKKLSLCAIKINFNQHLSSKVGQKKKCLLLRALELASSVIKAPSEYEKLLLNFNNI